MWIETFILGFIAGWIGAMIFIPKIGRRLARKRRQEMMEAIKNGKIPGIVTIGQIEEIRDGEGNIVEKDDPRWQEAVAELRKICPDIQLEENDKPEKPQEDD